MIVFLSPKTIKNKAVSGRNTNEEEYAKKFAAKGDENDKRQKQITSLKGHLKRKSPPQKVFSEPLLHPSISKIFSKLFQK